MQNAIVVKGWLVGPRNVELDEAVSLPNGRREVEVIVKSQDQGDSTGEEGASVFEFLRQLPAGTRSKADIDRELLDERSTWDEH